MIVRIGIIIVVGLVLLAIGYWQYTERIKNPQVAKELVDQPEGELAKRVMLIALPSGREVPVNYWREPGMVYAGADGRWWRELEGEGAGVSVLVGGEWLRGHARAVVDDPDYTKRIFAKLRPNAVPGFGTLVVIRLDGSPDPDETSP